ncbi:MAG: Wadjet anti-phage system protein JetA family protein, partial [Bacilli bacterium]
MTKLFDKIPDELFSPLSRKYKTIYSYALVCLYHLLKTRKNDIRRSEYAALLRSQGTELLELFDLKIDQLDDYGDEEKIVITDEKEKAKEDESVLGEKINYIIRKLAKCGWYIISKNPKTNIELIFIPAYSIQFMRLIDELTSDASSYLPLVHQTYAELVMEDEKEDDYMYRSLMNARANADNLEMSVTLLRQQICVFGNRLSFVLDPNEALKQHFDEYRNDIADRYYHPMKTFDSLGLYSQPTIAILRKWLKSERIVTLLAREAKAEPVNSHKKEGELASEVIKTISEIIDIFSRITSAFDDIDTANANYTEAVQKKVNYLASSDKTAKGKIDRIILAMAQEIKNNPALSYEEMPVLTQASESMILPRQGFFNSASLNMPFKRGTEDINTEPLP